MKSYYQQDGITIYCGDCREILPQLPKVDLVLTDPPYGINADTHRKSLPDSLGRVRVEAIKGDNSTELAAWLLDWLPDDMPAVVWGANCYPELLPHRGRWCCWDKRLSKRLDAMLGSPFELAWENRTSGFDAMVRVQHGGVVNADSVNGNNERRQHPTQKPARLMSKIIERYKNAETVCDPFMGSGTTLRAAKDLGRSAIGIEIEERYCEIAANRLAQGVLPFTS